MSDIGKSHILAKQVSLLTLWTLASAAIAVIAYRRGQVKGACASGSRVNGLHSTRDSPEKGDGGDDDNEDIGSAESVLSLWFDGPTAENHRTRWFAQGENVPRIDAIIQENFGELVLKAEAGELTRAWSRRPLTLVALILLLDQFSSEERLVRAMEEACEREECLEQSRELLKRFKKATNRRLQGIQDTAEEGAEILEHFEFEPKDESEMDQHQLVKVLRGFLDERGGITVEKLRVPQRHLSSSVAPPGVGQEEVASGIACMERMEESSQQRDAAVASVVGSGRHGSSSSGGAGGRGGALKHVAVSLSGGVDSMALCRALVRLRPLYGFEVVGIHIDYGNRHESGREADFVERWCARHGVIFYKRAIEEVRRGVTGRDEYEKVAREIRFNAYKDALKGNVSEGTPPTVMFGHHKGDVEENVLTNLIKGCSILGLAGMLPENIVNGVRVWRPMLPFGKDVVFDFAHKFGVPYFKDTTPSWSTRGKLRRQLVPMMEDVFGSSVLGHLAAVARESDDLRELVHRAIFQPVWDKVDSYSLGVRLDVEPYRHHGLLFWKETLREIVHSMGMPMIRDKTLGMFVREVLQRDGGVNPIRDGWAELRKEYAGLLKGGSLFIFRTGVFLPPNTTYGQEADGTPVPLHGAQVDVGPWRITSEESGRLSAEGVQECNRGRPPGTITPPFGNINELMCGRLTYTVAVPDTPGAALTVQPGATARAPAWTEVDPRIRRALPVVAPVPTQLAAPSLAEVGARMITIMLEYKGVRHESGGFGSNRSPAT